MRVRCRAFAPSSRLPSVIDVFGHVRRQNAHVKRAAVQGHERNNRGGEYDDGFSCVVRTFFLKVRVFGIFTRARAVLFETRGALGTILDGGCGVEFFVIRVFMGRFEREW